MAHSQFSIDLIDFQFNYSTYIRLHVSMSAYGLYRVACFEAFAFDRIKFYTDSLVLENVIRRIQNDIGTET